MNKLKLKISLLVGLFLCLRLLSQYSIQEKPIRYDTERERLSIDYLKNRHGIIQNSPAIQPIMIVLHYTAGGTIASNYSYFNRNTIENSRTLNKNQSELNVSAHYLIDRDGTIYHLVDDNKLARHTIGLNYCAIGVENIGSKKEPLTQKQIEANVYLIEELCKKHPIQYLIGHYEYLKFRNSELWKENNPKYITYKEDPGKVFMSEVRKRIKHLALKDTP